MNCEGLVVILVEQAVVCMLQTRVVDGWLCNGRRNRIEIVAAGHQFFHRSADVVNMIINHDLPEPEVVDAELGDRPYDFEYNAGAFLNVCSLFCIWRQIILKLYDL